MEQVQDRICSSSVYPNLQDRKIKSPPASAAAENQTNILLASIVDSVINDDQETLVSRFKTLFEAQSAQENQENEKNDPSRAFNCSLASAVMHIACQLDSVHCATAIMEGDLGGVVDVNLIDDSGQTYLHTAAEFHSMDCIDLLLSKEARTDLKSKDSCEQIAIEAALSSSRIVEKKSDESVEQLITKLTKTEFGSVKLLAQETEDIQRVAYLSAMEGSVVRLAYLLMAVPEKVFSSIIVLRSESAEACKETTTIYECVVREALLLGKLEGMGSRRKLLLEVIELLQQLEATEPRSSVTKCLTNPEGVTPLIRAVQALDFEVMTLLLSVPMDVNETDRVGNSALHWYLEMSSNTLNTRILRMLLNCGANVRQKNKLGLTPLHIAAADKNYPALKILLQQDSVVKRNKQRTGPKELQAQLKDAVSEDESLPSWVIVFKYWLPGYLDEVLKCHEEGEGYPLSYLKGDFMNNFGLELDHASLGYSKLSDFIQSFPGICGMKNVAVTGHGPATHVVLLPNFPNLPRKQKQNHSLTNTEFPDNNLMISLANFGYVGSGGQEKSISGGVNNSDTVSQNGPGFTNQGLMDLKVNKESFSLFARQYDFIRKYKTLLLEKKCFNCEEKFNPLSAYHPCGHLCPLCDDCKTKVDRSRCLICDHKVESIEPHPRPNPTVEPEPPASPTKDEELPKVEEFPKDEDFPQWDLKALQTVPKKKRTFLPAFQGGHQRKR